MTDRLGDPQIGIAIRFVQQFDIAAEREDSIRRWPIERAIYEEMQARRLEKEAKEARHRRTLERVALFLRVRALILKGSARAATDA